VLRVTHPICDLTPFVPVNALRLRGSGQLSHTELRDRDGAATERSWLSWLGMQIQVKAKEIRFDQLHGMNTYMAVTLLMTPPLVPVLGAAAAGVVRKAEQRSGARKKRREKGRGGGGRGGRGSLMPDTWRPSKSRQAEMQRREVDFFYRELRRCFGWCW
jgi:hypothetical protein